MFFVLWAGGHSLPSQGVDVNSEYGVAMQRGIALAQGGKLAAAEAQFELVLVSYASDPRALTALGQVQEQEGKLSESILNFRKVVSLDPKSIDSHINLGIALGDDSNFDAALSESTATVRLDASSANAHFLRGRVLKDLDRNDEAKAEFSRVLDIAPNYAEALRYLSEIEGDAGHLAEQVNLLERYLRLRPDQASAYIQLGEARKNEGKKVAAISAWRQAIRLDPDNSVALYSLAKALRPTAPLEADRLMQQVASINENRRKLDKIKMLGNQADAEIYDAEYPAAIDHINEAMLACGDCGLSADLHKNLGLAYWHKGDLIEGRRQLLIAKDLNPKDSEIKRGLELIDEQISIGNAPKN